MTEKINAFIVDIVRYSDSKNVVTLFSRERGRLACLSPSSATRNGRMRNAMLLPLSVIRTEMNFNETRELQYLGRIELLRPWKTIYFNPFKSAVALFLTEFLNRYLRTAAPDAPAFDFTVNSLALLDSGETEVANFHIAFLVRFLSMAGIQPDISDLEPGDCFDMLNGTAVPAPPRHSSYLDARQTAFMPVLFRINYRNSRFFKFSAQQRQQIISLLLRYYAVHYPGLDKLKSPEVLGEIFS